MEKRTIVAVLLTLLWLMVWQAIFAPPPSKQARRPVEGLEGAGSARTIAPAPEGGGTDGAPELPAGEGEAPGEGLGEGPGEGTMEAPAEEPAHGDTITVVTPLYRAELDTRGASIASFQLSRYPASCASGAPHDLVEATRTAERPLGVDLWVGGGAKGKQINTREVLFSSSRRSLDLTHGAEAEEGEIVFAADIEDVGKIEKRLRFRADRYAIEAEVGVVEPLPDGPVLYGVIVPLFLRDVAGAHDRYNGRSVVRMGGRKANDLDRFPLSRILAGKDDPRKLEREGGVQWAGYNERYFLRVLLQGGTSPLGMQVGRADAALAVVRGVVRAAPEGGAHAFTLYLGPKSLEDLELAEKSLAKAVDFGMFGDVLPRFFLWMLKGFHRFVGNYGIAIIVLTVVVRAAMIPLTLKSLKSMRQMQKVQPEFQALREKFKDQPEKLNQEIMNLYRRYKINPLGGCLPMVLQLPVFLGLYYGLLNTIELRCAPFALWIQDLSQPDRLGTLAIPFVTPAGIPVLTVLMGGTMYLQQRLTPVAGDPTQMKILQWMPVIFTFMFLSFPSGLTIYWLFSNLVSILQQLVINRMADQKRVGG